MLGFLVVISYEVKHKKVANMSFYIKYYICYADSFSTK
jgi:hypothetical protein